MKKFLLFLCGVLGFLFFIASLAAGFLFLISIFGLILSVLQLFGIDKFGNIFDTDSGAVFGVIAFSVIALVCVLLLMLSRFLIIRLLEWAEKLEKSIEKPKAQKRRSGYRFSSGGYSGYSGYSGYNQTLHDDLDAIGYASRITDRYGQDWSGYDPEGPGLGLDPDSYAPSGYDPEAWNGPDITGL